MILDVRSEVIVSKVIFNILFRSSDPSLQERMCLSVKASKNEKELAELPPGAFATAEQSEGSAFVSFAEYLTKHLK